MGGVTKDKKNAQQQVNNVINVNVGTTLHPNVVVTQKTEKYTTCMSMITAPIAMKKMTIDIDLVVNQKMTTCSNTCKLMDYLLVQ